MYPEKKGGSHKMARPQQNWGLLILLTRWASIWTMPNTASPKSEPPCGRAVYTPVRATILGHPPQKTAPGGIFIEENGFQNIYKGWPFCFNLLNFLSCTYIVIYFYSLEELALSSTGISNNAHVDVSTEISAFQCLLGDTAEQHE